MENKLGKRSRKQLQVHFQAADNEDELRRQSKRSGSFSSSDSSSLELSFAEKDFPSGSLLQSLQNGAGSQDGTSPPEFSPHTSVESLQSGSSTKFPPVQIMGKPPGYDPNRIPTAAFSSKPATPMEWSTTSNESLFSIHIGNSSFSRDHAILLAKSQELNKLDEASNYPASLPPVNEAMDTERESVSVEKGVGESEASVESGNVVLIGTAEDPGKEKVPPSEGVRSSVASYYSDGGSSTRSFAFPVFAGGAGRNSPMRVEADTEKQKSEPQTPEAIPNASRSNRLSFFSRCQLCCWRNRV